MRNLLFYDCDSLSKNTQIGMVVDFSFFLADEKKMLSDNPYTMKTLAEVKKFKISTDDQKENGLKTQKSVVDYWKNLPEDLKRISSTKNDLTIEQFVNSLLMYVNSEPQIHFTIVNNKSIQPLFLDNMFKITGKSIYEHFPINRCIDLQTYIISKTETTVFDFCPVDDEDFWVKYYNKNNSSWDVLSNVLKYQAILRAEHDLENILR